jgi:hypothetical protein
VLVDPEERPAYRSILGFAMSAADEQDRRRRGTAVPSVDLIPGPGEIGGSVAVGPGLNDKPLGSGMAAGGYALRLNG